MKYPNYRGKIVSEPTGHLELDWAFGDVITEHSTGKKFIVDLSNFDENTKLADVIIEVDPATVTKFTYLRDKNNNHIYENDIVRDERGNLARVLFLPQEMGYVLVYDKCDSRLGHRFRGSGYDIDENLEIVGNIFDNPEFYSELGYECESL